MTARYNQLGPIVAGIKAQSIIEVGVHRGLRAALMCKAALASHAGRVEYTGFDVFETESQAFQDDAMNGKGIAYQREAAKSLRAVADAHGVRLGWSFLVGRTTATLHGKSLAPDVAFIDGDHRLECIIDDYEALKGARIVVFDDYYVPDSRGELPIDLDVYGCNRLVDNLKASGANVTFPSVQDPCKHGGEIRLAIVYQHARP